MREILDKKRFPFNFISSIKKITGVIFIKTRTESTILPRFRVILLGIRIFLLWEVGPTVSYLGRAY